MANGNATLTAPRPNLQGAAAIPSIGPSQQMQSVDIVLAAGETRQVIIQGQWLYVKEAYRTVDASSADDVQIGSDICGPLPFNVGTGFRFPVGSQFRFLQVSNPATNGEVFLQIQAGYGDYIDNRLNIVRTRPASLQPVVDALADGIGAGISSIAATTAVAFPSTPPTGYLHRKSITISNLDPALPLYIRDGSGAVLGVIFANTAQVYFLSGDVEVYNPNPAPVACYVGEIWYLPQQP